MTVTEETRLLMELFEQVEDIEEVAESLPLDDHRRKKLADVADRILAKVPPVRPVVAGALLDMTDKTVRAWANEGVLTVLSTEPRMLLDPARLHEVLHLVTDLRRAGKTRGLLDEVYRRLSDQALLDREDLARSIDQMHRGEGRVVRQAKADS
ncbi:hypothetical protein [Allokutzneria oryzae]|uniref:Uncharacterized protein n=1 Tax=Allokutzneria oryzae TaxID=1378989 RepID=A0ABV5ZZN3_9PSEU